MKGLLGLFSCILLVGCAITGPTYVMVDSTASHAAAEKRVYYLSSGRRELTLENPQYRKYAGLTDELLQGAGFTKVDSPDDANVIVALIYGVDRMRDGNRMKRTSFVELAAYDWIAVRDEGVRNTIWRTEIYTDGSHGGYSRNIPMLLEAAAPYVATNMIDPVDVVFE
jgi:hypothetical protein